MENTIGITRLIRYYSLDLLPTFPSFTHRLNRCLNKFPVFPSPFYPQNENKKKGGDPSPASARDTLLRLKLHRRIWPLPIRSVFSHSRLCCLDGRCVQDPRTYSPRPSDPRLLLIPTSWGQVAAPNLN